jgi:hypothetical protein
MAIGNNDIIRVTTQTAMLGMNCLNVFTYRAEEVVGAPTYEAVADSFEQLYDATVNFIIHPEAVLNLVKVENLTNEIDIFTKVFSDAGRGANAGQLMPPYVTYSIRLLRSSKITRHGSKRFAGVGENFVNGGVWTAGGAGPQEIIEFCKDHITVDPTGDVLAVLRPVIIGRTLAIVDGAETYPLDLGKVNPVQDADFRGISTQNTRKYGRGI